MTHEQPDALLTRAINYVKAQKEIDIPEGWESILGLLCAKFFESEHLTEPGKMIGAVCEQPDGLLTRAINFVKSQKEIDIPEGWENILGLLCAKFYEHEQKEATP